MESESPDARVLLVEDDARLASMVADFLSSQGFDVVIEGRGDDAVARIHDLQPDAVVLDVNLPGKDGFEICRGVRPSYRGPIIMLTARGDEQDEVLGLEAGADDYLSKPVRPRALLARLRMHLRRGPASEESAPNEPVEVGALTIDPRRRSAELAGEELDLTTAEFELLYLLASNAGRPLNRNDLYQEIHGIQYDGLDRSIDLRISRLRKKLGDDPAKPHRIKSVRGVGYLFSMEP